jgi:EamA domain-containing membrane protein RarD
MAYLVGNEVVMKTILLTGVSAKKVLAVVIIGSLVFMCLLMAILYSWKKCKLPKSKLWNAGNVVHITNSMEQSP